MQEEIWKDVIGYEGLYQVSNLGRVKSLPKTWVAGKGTIKKHDGIILKLIKDIYGYYLVNLCKENKQKTLKVHQLVAIAFLNHTPCGHKLVIDHIDNNPLNNNVFNLQIVTHRYNTHKQQGRYTSIYKGVHWSKVRKKWMSNIRINGKTICLGAFNEEIEAGIAYQNQLKEIIE